MNLEQLNTRLTKIIEQRRLKAKLEQDLTTLQKELKEESARLKSLSERMEKENVDVEKLERTSLAGLFYTVLGSREQQLEKERQEALAAQLAYQQTRHQVESLEYERFKLLHQSAEMENVETEYKQLLVEKEAILQQSGHPATRGLAELSEKEAGLNADLKDIHEAISAGREVLSALDYVIGSLESAENWGTWDMLGGGFLSTAIKHSRIDDAHSGIQDVQAKLRRFQRELADVRQCVDLRIDIGSFETFADYFFDGLIVDWVIQSKINDSLERARGSRNAIDGMLGKLRSLGKATENSLQDCRQKQIELLESA